MTKGADFGEHPIRYFDGGLFDDDACSIWMGKARPSARDHAVGLVRDRAVDLRHAVYAQPGPDQRAMLGAQYTSKQDILLIVEPVLMAPLRREWAEFRSGRAAGAESGPRTGARDPTTS